MHHRRKTLAIVAAALATTVATHAQTPPPPDAVTLFANVRIFDGKSAELSAASHVLVRGSVIEKISTQPIATDKRGDTRIIDGAGRTLMPGLIDNHVHVFMGAASEYDPLDATQYSLDEMKAADDWGTYVRKLAKIS